MLEHTSRRLYQLAEVWDYEIYQLQVRLIKGIFLGETALFLSDLTDRTPIKFNMTFLLNYNVNTLHNENVKCTRTRLECYELGIVQVKTPSGNPVKAYSMERTLCDILRKQNHIDIQIISEAFKRCTKRSDKNILLLYEYASNLKVKMSSRAYL